MDNGAWLDTVRVFTMSQTGLSYNTHTNSSFRQNSLPKTLFVINLAQVRAHVYEHTHTHTHTLLGFIIPESTHNKYNKVVARKGTPCRPQEWAFV